MKPKIYMKWFKKKKPTTLIIPVGFDGELTHNEIECIKHWKEKGRFNLPLYFKYKQFLIDKKNEENPVK